MLVKRIQNNSSYNQRSFGAKLQLKGQTEDISTKFLKAWEEKADLIGREGDTVCIRLGERVNEDYDLHEFGRPPHYSGIKRSITGNVIFENGTNTKKERIGYRISRERHSHEEMTNNSISDFLNILKDKIRK